MNKAIGIVEAKAPMHTRELLGAGPYIARHKGIKDITIQRKKTYIKH